MHHRRRRIFVSWLLAMAPLAATLAYINTLQIYAAAMPIPGDAYNPPPGYVLFALAGEPMSTRIVVPEQFARDAVRIIGECENKGWDPTKVSATGDYGLLQINAYWHFARMRALGLRPMMEADRIWYAGNILYPVSGWGLWSCRHVLEHEMGGVPASR